MAKLERTYTVPLRKEFQRAPQWNRSKRAVRALRAFISKHMKSEDVRLGNSVNEAVWKNGIKNPPHHVKVSVVKDDEDVVRVELFGFQPKKQEKAEEKKPAKKEVKEKKEAASEKKAEQKNEAKSEKPAAKKTEEKTSSPAPKKEQKK